METPNHQFIAEIPSLKYGVIIVVPSCNTLKTGSEANLDIGKKLITTRLITITKMHFNESQVLKAYIAKIVIPTFTKMPNNKNR